MTWNNDEIKEAFEAGNTGQYSHMLVACDSFDYENYPIYVPRGQDPKSHRPSNGDSVDEAYSYDLSLDYQLREHRALHWDYDPSDDFELNREPPVVASSESELRAKIEVGAELSKEIQSGDLPMDIESIRKRFKDAIENPLTQWARDIATLFAEVDRLQGERELVAATAELVAERERELNARKASVSSSATYTDSRFREKRAADRIKANQQRERELWAAAQRVMLDVVTREASPDKPVPLRRLFAAAVNEPGVTATMAQLALDGLESRGLVYFRFGEGVILGSSFETN